MTGSGPVIVAIRAALLLPLPSPVGVTGVGQSQQCVHQFGTCGQDLVDQALFGGCGGGMRQYPSVIEEARGQCLTLHLFQHP